MPKVQFPSRLTRKLYANCRKAFPNEEFAILLGRSAVSGNFKVEELYFPEERLNTLNPDFVNIQPSWFEDAYEIAQAADLEILGDIHSHCYQKEDGGYPGIDPSEADWDYSESMKTATGGKYRLMGIVRVLKSGKKISCRSRFWPSIEIPKIVK